MTISASRTAQFRRVRCQSWQNRCLVSAVLLFPITSPAVAVGDPSATRTVYLTTIALVLLGIALAVLAWWLVRRTRPEPELFAPLEQMETRSWRKLDVEERRESLDSVRPFGARPVATEEAEDIEQLDDIDEADDIEEVDDADMADDLDEADPADGADPADESHPAAGVDGGDEADNGHAVVGGAEAGRDEISTDGGDLEDDPTVAIKRARST